MLSILMSMCEVKDSPYLSSVKSSLRCSFYPSSHFTRWSEWM